MTPDEADWLFSTVLPRWAWSEVLRLCPCQYGPCGWCNQLGKHHKCPKQTHPEWRVESPARRVCRCGVPDDPRAPKLPRHQMPDEHDAQAAHAGRYEHDEEE